MNKVLLIAFVICTFFLSAKEKPANIIFGVKTGYGWFNHDELKMLNRTVISSLPFNSTIIDEFEPSLNYGAYSQFEILPRFFLGLEYFHFYTGSRLGQKDFSGYYSFDQYLESNALGLKFGYELLKINKFSFNTYANSGLSLSNWQVESNLNTGTQIVNKTDKLKGVNWYVWPEAVCNFNLSGNMSFIGSIGYSIDLTRNYKSESKLDVELTRNPDWSGFRMSLGLQYKL
ncbi:MAG: hypothetical protein A2066_13415 [Bacteroidetes bacterium GWB2_41_8]|nr:MAG: hypothetical protein A2066_13415 [Bacteroidetes bacterium GWB2_41_8]